MAPEVSGILLWDSSIPAMPHSSGETGHHIVAMPWVRFSSKHMTIEESTDQVPADWLWVPNSLIPVMGSGSNSSRVWNSTGTLKVSPATRPKTAPVIFIQNTRKTKELNLNDVIAFLKEQGADESTINLIETQCSGKGTESADTCSKLLAVQDAKKQSISESTDAFQAIQESVKGSSVLIFDFQQGRALNHSKDPAVATTTI